MTGLFETRDVLEAVRNAERFQLLLRDKLPFKLHRITPSEGSIATPQ
jgi:hypothetical protein